MVVLIWGSGGEIEVAERRYMLVGRVYGINLFFSKIIVDVSLS